VETRALDSARRALYSVSRQIDKVASRFADITITLSAGFSLKPAGTCLVAYSARISYLDYLSSLPMRVDGDAGRVSIACNIFKRLIVRALYPRRVGKRDLGLMRARHREKFRYSFHYPARRRIDLGRIARKGPSFLCRLSPRHPWKFTRGEQTERERETSASCAITRGEQDAGNLGDVSMDLK